MAILSLNDLSFSYGDLRLIEGATLQIEPGERIALVGRNGTGKSTLMKVLRGELEPESGSLRLGNKARVAYLLQEIPRNLGGTVYDVVASGLLEVGDLLAAYHRVSHDLAEGADALDELEDIQHRLEAADGWLAHRRVETAIEHLQLPADRPLAELSGGMIRRVLLARELVSLPDLLLLDEPTNHLDIAAIEWLEEFLLSQTTTSLLFVTHDRRFLERLATRIIELDRGRLTSWPGNYQVYLQRKEEALAIEAVHAAQFDKKLAKEEAWIRQGIKARRTRNEGRVRALQKLRQERMARRQQLGPGQFQSLQGERSGKIVVEAEGIHFSFDDKPLIKDFSTVICRGDRVGLIGPNGSGKTTLVRLLLGELQPEQGTLKLGTKIEVGYFDQYRAQLDEDATVADNVARSEFITVGDKKRHIISYLGDFLFTGEQCRGPIHGLSGGERNRLLLAKLFALPTNVLVMDEPTNDLDVETLELLEEILVEYQGTVLLVSHDRAFLDNVVTSTLVMEGDGKVGEYVGGYEDWLRQRQDETTATAPPPSKKSKGNKPPPAAAPRQERPRKLSFKEKQELAGLPAAIERLETEQRQIHEQQADPDIYRQGGDKVIALNERLADIESTLATSYERWEDLEARAGDA